MMGQYSNLPDQSNNKQCNNDKPNAQSSNALMTQSLTLNWLLTDDSSHQNRLKSALAQTQGGLTAELWDDGVLCFRPNVDNSDVSSPNVYDKAVVVSAGIHGNETAPIELLAYICDDILTNQLPCQVALLVIFGNLPAIKNGVRYVNNDMNRLFGADAKMPNSQSVATANPTTTATFDTEWQRAKQLEQHVQRFFEQMPARHHYHYDLHTAIRSSLLPTFALLPKQSFDYDDGLLASLLSSELHAITYHTQRFTTFANFSADLGVNGVTLELGKVRAFGQNNLADFVGIDTMLRALLANLPLPVRQSPMASHFLIDNVIIKASDEFVLLVDDNTPNFSPIPANTAIANNNGEIFSLPKLSYSLFLNAKVKAGLRAGLLMTKIATPPKAVTPPKA